MWKSDLQIDKYQYARTNPYRVKLIGFLGILSTLLMGYGLWNYLYLKTIYLFIFGPIVFIFITNKLLRYFIQLFYQKFDIKKHIRFVQEFWAQNQKPPVDIFLPWAGEEHSVHEEVIKAVSQLNYSNYKVYMLDDIGNIEHEELAKKYGFIYLSRPNKGEYKKSGNLQYGYENSSGDYVLILDADFIPIKDALKDLIPYIASDSEIGILQTPQYFEQSKDVHHRSKIEFGGGNIVEDFYRIILPCRDELKAAMCVGTSAIYRRSAIEKLQGTPKVHASEDLATGLLITQYGFYVKYLPLIVSMGKSPDTFQGYFKQHMRWCSGNLVFANYWPIARLSLAARLTYLINPMYYLSEALTVIFSFQFLVLLYFHSDSLSLYHTLYFLPYIILSRVITPFTKTNKNKLGTKLAALNNSYTYFYTCIRMIFRGIPTWQPTGVKTNELHNDFVQAFNIGTIISTTYIIVFLFVLLSRPEIFGNYNTYGVLAWSFYSVFWNALFLTFIAEYIHPFRLAGSKTHTKRALAFANKHLMLMLFFILLGAAIFNSIIALRNPKAPTIIALKSLNVGGEDIDKISNKIAIASTETPQNIAVLAATAISQEEVSYPYTVENGDSIIRLAKYAIREYLGEESILLSQKQIDNAAYRLYLDSYKSITIKPGDKVTFNEVSILRAISNVELK